VRKDEAVLTEPLVNGIEARVLDVQALDVLVDLDADTPVCERRLEIDDVIRVVEVHRRQREAVPAEVARGLGQPGV
jgi:predicted protein tyrosine phosphatase